MASCYKDLTDVTVADSNNTDADKAANGEIQVEQLPADQEQF